MTILSIELPEFLTTALLTRSLTTRRIGVSIWLMILTGTLLISAFVFQGNIATIGGVSITFTPLMIAFFMHGAIIWLL